MSCSVRVQKLHSFPSKLSVTHLLLGQLHDCDNYPISWYPFICLVYKTLFAFPVPRFFGISIWSFIFTRRLSWVIVVSLLLYRYFKPATWMQHEVFKTCPRSFEIVTFQIINSWRTLCNPSSLALLNSSRYIKCKIHKKKEVLPDILHIRSWFFLPFHL